MYDALTQITIAPIFILESQSCNGVPLSQAVITLLSDWEFKEATLIRQLDNGTVGQIGDEGLLYVTVVNEKTREERRGTVCHDGFNTQAARLFCQNMGYEVEEGVWGSYPDYKYVSE